jgi:dienelactone hydrolase
MKTFKIALLMLVAVLMLQCQQKAEQQSQNAQKNIKTQTVEYEVNGVKMKGYLAYNAGLTNKRPGILVVHEWWGANDYSRKRAEMLAELGYTAFALDMYGEGKVAQHPEEAMAFATETMKNMPDAEKRFFAAMRYLQQHSTVDSTKIAAIGYCFGGSVVLHMARVGAPLKGVVSFHGGLTTQMPAEPGKVKASILVCNGADDSFVKPEHIETFKAEMDNAGVDYQIINYPGAIHGFTNPAADSVAQKFGLKVAYNKTADVQSWQAMWAFLKRIFSE